MASRPLHSDPAALVALLSGPGRFDLTRFLIRQRWFAAKTRGIAAVEVLDWAVLDPDGPLVLLLLAVDGDRYYVPATVSAEATPEATLARAGAEAVVDAHDDPRFGRRVLAAIASGRSADGRHGRFAFRPTAGWAFPPDPDALAARRLTGEQSNTSVVVGDLVLKSLRRLAERGGGGGEGRHAGRDGVGDAGLIEAAKLLAQGAPDREIAGMQPRHVVAGVGRAPAFVDDLVERHRRGVDDARARRAMLEQRPRHERAGIEADRAARDQVAAAHGDEIGRAGAGADEVDGHRPSPVAMAQVARSVATRVPSSRPLRPAPRAPTPRRPTAGP